MWNQYSQQQADAQAFTTDSIKAEKENYDVAQYQNAYQKAYDLHRYHQTLAEQTDKLAMASTVHRTSLGSCDDSGVVNNVSSENISNSSSASTTPPNVYRSPTSNAETPNFYAHHQYFGKLDFCPNNYYYPTMHDEHKTTTSSMQF